MATFIKMEVRTKDEAKALYKMYLSLFVHATDLDAEEYYCNKTLEAKKILRSFKED